MREKTVMSSRKPLPKMMLGFVIRRCAVAVGHDPNPEEFAAWANSYRDGERSVYLFGRAISVQEAQVMLRHQSRPVAARSAAPYERIPEDGGAFLPGKVTFFSEAKARLQARARGKTPSGRS
jgi:hypothetical protein